MSPYRGERLAAHQSAVGQKPARAAGLHQDQARQRRHHGHGFDVQPALDECKTSKKTMTEPGWGKILSMYLIT